MPRHSNRDPKDLGFPAVRSSNPRRSRISRYLPLLLWMAVIFFASTGEFSAANTSSILSSVVRWLLPGTSDKQLALIHLLTRKLGHFTEFAILGFFTARAFSTSSRNFLRRAWFRWGVLLVVFYAFLDEYHQSFVPSRTPSVYDSLIDITGGLTVLLVFEFWQKRKSSWVSR